jgi:hypothetical protein
LQLNNSKAPFKSRLLVKSLASAVKKNTQYIPLVPEMFLTNEKADSAVSTGDFVTTLVTTTGLVISIILSLSPKADTQPECLDQTCPLVPCTYLVSTVEPTDSTLSLNISEHTLEVSQQTSLDTLDRTTSTYCLASYDLTIRSPLIILQTEYRPVSKEA